MKESIYTPYPKAIFRESFNDEQTTRKNGGVPTDISFANGKGEFNGTSSKVNYNLGLNGTYSVRIRCNPTSFAQYMVLFDIRGSNNDGVGYSQLNITTGAIGSSSGTNYVNGVATSSVVAGVSNEIIITGISLKQGTGANLSLIGSRYADFLEFLGTMDLVEIYQGTLTASEVANLYNDTWNKEQNFSGSAKSDVVVNGTFDTDSDWNLTFGAEISGGLLNLDIAAYSATSQSGRLTIGKKYRFEYTVSNYVSGKIRLQLGTGHTDTTRTANGTYSSEGIATTTDSVLISSFNVAFEGSIDNIIVQELNPKTLIDFSATEGVIDLGDLNETSTATDVTVNKNGALFNGTTSGIDLGVLDNTGVKSISGWIKPLSFGENNAGHILSDGDYFSIFITTGDDRLAVTRNGSDTAYSANDSIKLGQLMFFYVISAEDGTTNIYLGDKTTAPVLSGSADQDAGSPQLSTDSTHIGNRDADDRAFDGYIAKIKDVSGDIGLISATQVWSSSLREVN